MAPLDALPTDQRAVVELVLVRGRDYDTIARLLSIDRAGVRLRALAALDTLGGAAPEAEVPAPRRALITDYLLGQLPERVAGDVAQRLEREPAEAAWARTVAGALAPIADGRLPAIPEPASAPEVTAEEAPPIPVAGAVPTGQAMGPGEGGPGEDAPGEGPGEAPGTPASRPASRRGGAVVLGLGLLALIAVIVILVAALSGGSSSTGRSSSTAATAASSPASTVTTPKNATAPMKLLPVATGSKAQGVAEAFKQSGGEYLAIVAVNLPANGTTAASRNYYAVWLSNAAGANRLLGFAPPVTSNGQLRAATKLASTDAGYTKLLVTLETKPHPSAPGSLVLSGAFTYAIP